MMRLISLIMLVLCLPACSSDQPATATEAKPTSEPTHASGAIPQHQLDALTKAKNTEDLLRANDERRRKAIEQQSE